MAIPDKPLEISVDPDDMTLGDLVLFDPDVDLNNMTTEEGIRWGLAFRAYLINHSNWTRSEIDKLKASELGEVFERARDKVAEEAVPLASETEPETGPAAKTKPRRRPGSSSDKSPGTTA